MVSVPPKDEIEQLTLSLEHNALKKEYEKLLAEDKFPKTLIDKAYEITIRRLEAGYKNALQQPGSYFRKVLFSLLFENQQVDDETQISRAHIKERLLLKAFVQDLLEAGYARPEIYRRLIDIYGEKISYQVLEEFEKSLLKPNLKVAHNL